MIRTLRALVLVAVAWSSPAAAKPVAYAISIGNNEPPDASLPVLRYADDDAVRYHQLFSRFATEAHLLAVLDAETQRRYPALGVRAEAPTLANLFRIVNEYASRMTADVQRGDQPVLYLAFSGHGSVDATHGAFVAMLDGPLTRERLYADVIGPLPAAYVHLIVDACNAGAVVGVRGPREVDAHETDVTLPERLAVAEGAQRSWPTVGVVISATAGQESHEWSRIESGVFTHEVLSGLLGAADVNHDGQIEYSELAAFIAAANRDLPDPRAVPHAVVRPPPINGNASLIAVDALRGSVFLTGNASKIGHFYLELDNGQRYLDAHLAQGTAARIALPAHARMFIRTGTREAAIATDASGSVAIADLAFHASPVQARGSVETAYRASLFLRPYGDAYYRGFVDSAGLAPVTFQPDAPAPTVAATPAPAPRESPAAPDRRLAIGLAITGGVAGVTAIVSGALAYSAKRDYNGTSVQRDAHDAAATYTRDTRIALVSGIVALGSGAASYWLWPRPTAPRITAAVSRHEAAIGLIAHF
jgi:Caspase domain